MQSWHPSLAVKQTLAHHDPTQTESSSGRGRGLVSRSGHRVTVTVPVACSGQSSPEGPGPGGAGARRAGGPSGHTTVTVALVQVSRLPAASRGRAELALALAAWHLSWRALNFRASSGASKLGRCCHGVSVHCSGTVASKPPADSERPRVEAGCCFCSAGAPL
jgi:hypothetical protein